MKLIRSTFEKNFIEHTMLIALPIMLKNGITNFVNMLDNIMVGRIGTDPMTGVSVVNSLLFVWNLCVFASFISVGVNLVGNYILIFGKFGTPALSVVFPRIYNTSDGIRALATRLICVVACIMPIQAFNNASYFIIRSGGKTWITFLFDSFFCWVVSIPAAFFLAHYTQIPIVPMFALVTGSELLKVGIGLTLVNRGVWIRDITV